MTPCEKLGYKVGDRFEVVGGGGSADWPVGTIVILHMDDGTSNPAFRKDGEEWKHDYNSIRSVRPLKLQTEAEKRGAKFGTMGVVKETGERCVFIGDSLVVSGFWEIDVEGKANRWHRVPSEIRLDHEPEYKEIPFSEATDEQRMDVGNLILSGGSKINGIEKSICGRYYMLTHGGVMCTTYDEDGNGIHFSDFTDPASYILTVRVPA